MKHLILEKIHHKLSQFPKVFDRRLIHGLDRLSANTSIHFFAERTYRQLKTLLIIQFFLQQKIELALESKGEQKPLFVKLVQHDARVCCALTYHISYGFHRDSLVNLFHTLLPGIQSVPHSCYMWFHPELAYQFCYFEIDKLRGRKLSKKELRLLEKAYRDQLLTLPPLSPPLFWPYNAEESLRQVQLLQREMENPEDLPHISLLFQEQTPSALEFLIHYCRPQSTTAVEETVKGFPRSFDYFFRFKQRLTFPFPIEAGAFSVKVPSSAFVLRGSINLLYARRYIAKYLEMTFGPFRDYNGGFFEKQQTNFEHLRVNLSSKIPLFDLFAEKIFYALQPVEARLALTVIEAEKLFTAFSEILQKKENFAIVESGDNILVVKNGNNSRWFSDFQENAQNISAHAHLSLENANYYCGIGPHIASNMTVFLSKKHTPNKKSKTLRLCFQEGAPPSLDPHLSSGDMRCRMLSKLLFEGLMRLNSSGIPEPGGALHYFVSPNGLRYVFKLRPCFWSNGDRVTAIDFVSSWQRALRDHVSHPEQLFIIKNGRLFKDFKCEGDKLGIRAQDATTLEIELEQPDPYFLYKLAHPFFFPLLGTMREPKWFNGPYLIRSYHPDGLLLEKNPYFWSKERLCFEHIEIKWSDNLEGMYHAFQEGELDWIGDPLCSLSRELIEKLKQQGNLQKKEVNRRFVLHYNTQLPYLASANIRKALSATINHSEICNIFPGSQPIVRSTPSSRNPKELFELGLSDIKLSAASFPPLTFLYSHQTGRGQLGHLLKKTWEEELGVTIKLEELEWNHFRTRLERGEFELTVTIQEILENTPWEFLDRFEGANSWNFSQWEHEGYREMLNQALEAYTKESKMGYLKRAEHILNDQTPFVPLVKCTHLFAHTPKLKNCFFDGEGCVDFTNAYFEIESTKDG